MNTCQYCRHWERNNPLDAGWENLFGCCGSPKLAEEEDTPAPAADMLLYTDMYGEGARVMTGQDFGCIHWEAT
jgi:hypothetical protein